MMPSTEALLLHWRRCMWVLEVWHQAKMNDLDLPGTPHKPPSTLFMGVPYRPVENQGTENQEQEMGTDVQAFRAYKLPIKSTSTHLCFHMYYIVIQF